MWLPVPNERTGIRGKLLLIAVVVLASASVATAQPHRATRDGLPVAHHVKRSHQIIKRAYSKDRWQDPTPAKPAEKRAWQAHRRAILIANTRQQIGEFRDERRRLFDQYRASQLELAVTPFAFGEPTIPRVAIPAYIVRCETNGFYGASRWGAHNPSGAHGLYQMMPSTYGAYCESCDWSHLDQHTAAHKLYESQGSAPWSCA